MPFYGTGTILFQDAFTYSNGALATVGTAKWAAGYWTGQPSLRVVSNMAAGPSANGTWSDIYSKSTVSVGATGIEAIWTNITPSNNGSTWTYMHVLGAHAASPNGYYMRWRDASGFGYGFGKIVNGAFTVLDQSTTRPVTGDSCALQILPNGTISLWRKPSAGAWTQVGASVVDTFRTSGEIGMETFLTLDRWDSVEVRSIPAQSRLKRWNGSAWVQANLKRNNGSIWVPASLKKLP